MAEQKSTLKEVWSGGQDGAAIAGLRAAKAAALKTGGWIPKGFRTEGGRRPEYATLYGMKEHPKPYYPPRTAANVRDTDGTLILGDNPNSSGCALTQKFTKTYQKPVLILTTADMAEEGSIERVKAWIKEKGIYRLNVAGNRSAPEDVLEEWLVRVFSQG